MFNSTKLASHIKEIFADFLAPVDRQAVRAAPFLRRPGGFFSFQRNFASPTGLRHPTKRRTPPASGLRNRLILYQRQWEISDSCGDCTAETDDSEAETAFSPSDILIPSHPFFGRFKTRSSLLSGNHRPHRRLPPACGKIFRTENHSHAASRFRGG